VIGETGRARSGSGVAAFERYTATPRGSWICTTTRWLGSLLPGWSRLTSSTAWSRSESADLSHLLVEKSADLGARAVVGRRARVDAGEEHRPEQRDQQAGAERAHRAGIV
jgi:hypothetical protein